MLKFTKKDLAITIHKMGVNAVFMYDSGYEESSWNWLFMREFYKDLWEMAND